MKKLILALGLLLSVSSYGADIKISQLPLGAASSTTSSDSFPFVSASVNVTKRMTVWDLVNLPPMAATYAPKLNPIFTGTLTAPEIIVSGETASTVPYLNGSKQITSSSVTPTELGYVSGVTSSIQTQINAKAPTASPTFTGTVTAPEIIVSGENATTVPYLNASKQLTSSLTTPTELGYVHNVTSSLCGINQSCTVTNKTIDGGSNTITNVSLTSGITGTLGLTNGGTGQTSANAALNALLPAQTSNSGKLLTTNGTNTSWTTAATGTVTSVTFTGDGTVLSSTPSSAVTTSGTVTASLNNQSAATFLAGPTSGSAAAPTFRALQHPTIQKFTTGTSQTYTTPAGALYIRIRMVGGGGGGAGSGGSAGTVAGDGAASSFSTFTANGGAKGVFGGAGGAGGTGGSTSTGGLDIAGGSGQGATYQNDLTNNSESAGGMGGASCFGGAGAGGAYGTAGKTAAPNSGSGGGGGGANKTAGIYSGAGGGSGECVDAFIFSPAASYTYTVGGGGAGGAAGTAPTGNAGGGAGDGIIQVTEYYQ